MNESDFDEQKLLGLISNVLDGTIDETCREALNELLKQSPQARHFYRKHMELHARLHLSYEESSIGSMPELTAIPGAGGTPGLSPARSKTRGPAWWMGIAAALLIGLLANALVISKLDRSEGPAGEFVESSGGVAVLSRAIEEEWGAESPRYREGNTLPAGKLQLASGLLQIEFFGGASVILEGPAEFEILSEERARFHSGRLRAFVPEPAQGFTIEGPDFDVVDLGTEFAMSVDADGRGEVHVVDGEVTVHEKSGSLLNNLTSGMASRTTDSVSAELEAIESRGADFIGREQMAEMSIQHGNRQAEIWRQHRQRWAGDPDTLVFFDFENQKSWDRQLMNSKLSGPRGAIVGAQWTQGRWPGKGALEFKRPSDRVRIEIPGEFKSISFAAWVRIEGFDRWLSSLMLTDGWDSGEPHWQISDAGELILGINGMRNAYSPPVIGPQSLGKWLHVASVFDEKSQLVSHYLNGEVVSTLKVNRTVAVRFGAAEIGNWRSKDRTEDQNKIRVLNGRIDEFLILSRALSDSDIHDIYRNGAPGK